MPERPFVSVVIATRNRERLLSETLRSLVAQDWPRDRFDIIVADNGSTDGTRAVVDAVAMRPDAPAVRYLYVARPGKSFAVNAAIELAARADIVAFTDDDVRPERTWIASLCRAFTETGADFVAGRIFPLWEVDPPLWMSPAMYGVLAIPDNGEQRLPITADEQRVVPIGANMAARAGVMARIGGLRTDLGKLEGTLRTGEDHEFFLRMLAHGYRGVYEPTALVRHWVPRERLARSYCRRWLYQNGRDVARLQAQHTPAVKRLLGVPRYLWRQNVVNLARTLALHPAKRFAATTRVLWFAGYLRETWRAAQ
jgi:cellulose synthase/poly-beta-1,6-N-acetylglucosamine synthase-like glycosyltransferase